MTYFNHWDDRKCIMVQVDPDEKTNIDASKYAMISRFNSDDIIFDESEFNLESYDLKHRFPPYQYQHIVPLPQRINILSMPFIGYLSDDGRIIPAFTLEIYTKKILLDLDIFGTREDDLLWIQMPSDRLFCAPGMYAQHTQTNQILRMLYG